MKEYHHGYSINTSQSLVNEDEIVSKFVSFYMSLGDALIKFLHDLVWSPIDQQQAASLKVTFTEEEVGKAIRHLVSNKTPRTDEFTSFFKKMLKLFESQYYVSVLDGLRRELSLAT